MAVDTSPIDKVIAEIEATAYRRGVDDCARAFSKAMKDVYASLVEAKKSHKIKQKKPSQVRPGSNASRVYMAIRANPGMRGADLGRLLTATKPPVNERTMRTALIRLKRRGLIEQKDGGWFENPTNSNS